MTSQRVRAGIHFVFLICTSIGSSAQISLFQKSVSPAPARQSGQPQVFTVLYTFKGGADGARANSLIGDSASPLYGTTQDGGDLTCSNGNGCGTVFKLVGSHKTTLYTFRGGSDGAFPEGLLLRYRGSLYGTTTSGGANNGGTIFKISSVGDLDVLYSFPRNAEPNGGLVPDALGNLYGTLEYAGCCGAVFMLAKNGNDKVYMFKGVPNGATPRSALVRDAEGNFYATTEEGGNPDCEFDPPKGCGIIFKIDKSGKESVVHVFTGPDGEDAGDWGIPAPLVLDQDGNLYGTTPFGGIGIGNCGGGSEPCGTVYKLDTSGNLIVLYTFTGGMDGAVVHSEIARDDAGNIYGTTTSGGQHDGGTIFMLDTTNQLTVLHSFEFGVDGDQPDGLIRDSEGNLYGYTDVSSGLGTIFMLSN